MKIEEWIDIINEEKGSEYSIYDYNPELIKKYADYKVKEFNSYKKFRGFWIKFLNDKNRWKISLREDDCCCSVWVCSAQDNSMNQAIDIVLDNKHFLAGLKMKDEPLDDDFYKIYKHLIDGK